MADFETAFNITDHAEGKYSNDKDDKGGETYRGRSRTAFPNWGGWKIIDAHKADPDFPKCLDKIKELQDLVKKSYYEIEWNGIFGNQIHNQAIANELFDNAVNMGVSKSVEYLQRAINILNRNGRLYPDIRADGAMGQNTIIALNQSIKIIGAGLLLNIINGFQIKHYLTLMERNPVNEKYVGWFKRVEIMWN